MQRALVAIAMALLLAAPFAHAQQLQAALAPVQTAVDAAARVVDLAMREADRDGTPDEAARLRDALLAYADQLDRAWDLPESATYREEALAALPYVQEVSIAVASVPEAVGPLSRSGEQCGKRALTEDEHLALRTAEADLRGLSAQLDALALSAPQGVDASRLRAAADRLADWQLAYRGLPTCASTAPPRDFLTLTLQPATVWPTGTLRIHGATSLAGVVRLDAPALALARDVEVVEGRFALLVEVPRDARLGVSNVTATLGALDATRNLTVAKAPATLEIEAPQRVLPGEAFTATLTLTSPARDPAANVTLEGAFARVVPLVDGRATLQLSAPDTPGRVELLAHYAGSDVARAADALVTVEVVPAFVLPAGDVDAEGSRLPLVLGLAALVAGLAATAWLLARRPRRAGPLARASRAAHAPEEAAPVALVEMVARVHRRLRREGAIPPGATARESLGADAEDVVDAFERVRYGDEPEKASWRERAARWFRDAWSRLGGSGA